MILTLSFDSRSGSKIVAQNGVSENAIRWMRLEMVRLVWASQWGSMTRHWCPMPLMPITHHLGQRLCIRQMWWNLTCHSLGIWPHKQLNSQTHSPVHIWVWILSMPPVCPVRPQGVPHPPYPPHRVVQDNWVNLRCLPYRLRLHRPHQ